MQSRKVDMRGDIKIKDKDKLLILQKASEVPKPSWLPKNPTSDQQLHWEVVRDYHQLIYAELTAIFSDSESPLDTVPQTQFSFDTIDIKFWAQMYTDTYMALRAGWNDIKKVEIITDINPIYQQIYQNALNAIKVADTPGTLISMIIEDTAKGFFDDCLGYTDYSPNKHYKLTQKHKKVSPLLKNDVLTKNEQHNITAFDQQLNQMCHKMNVLPDLHDIVIGILNVIAQRDKQNKLLQMHLRRLDEIMIVFIEENQTALHPSKKPQKHGWNKGVKIIQ